MDKLKKIICLPIDYALIACVWAYKIFISPLKPKCCAYIPTCSTYMIEAIKEFHFFRGVIIGLKRLARCRPKFQGGFDPIPINLKGDIKWIL